MDAKLEYNMEYYSMTEAQARRFGELVQMKMSEYPQALRDYIESEVKRQMFSGDVLFSAIAEWVKMEDQEEQSG